LRAPCRTAEITSTYQRVEALVGDRVRTEEPLILDFALDALTQP
jgi:hypothetical protein